MPVAGTAPHLASALLAAQRDTSWPPILSMLVIGGAIAAAIAIIVLFRQLRAAARGNDRRGEEGPYR